MKYKMGQKIQLLFDKNNPSESAFIQEIKDKLTFKNTKYFKALQITGKPPWGMVPYLHAYSLERPGLLQIPIGAEAMVRQIKARYNDFTLTGKKVEDTSEDIAFTLKATLRPYQDKAVKELLANKCVAKTLVSATGTGKTCMSCAYIAALGKRTLVVVPSVELQNQWVKAIGDFLGIDAGEIGRIGGKKKSKISPVQSAGITVGIVNSVRKLSTKELAPFSLVVFDEVHKAASDSGLYILKNAPRYLLGVTATLSRSDAGEDLLGAYLGLATTVEQREQQVKQGYLAPFKVRTIHSDFISPIDGSKYFTKLKCSVCQDENRNNLMVDEAIKASETMGGITLLTGDLKKQCEILVKKLEQRGKKVSMLTGDVSDKNREGAIDELHAGESQFLVATTSLIREGVDIPAITTVVINTGVFAGNQIQLVGRALRPSEGKKFALILDVNDSQHSLLRTQHMKRLRAYRSIGGIIL